jgi:hypothetical protein
VSHVAAAEPEKEQTSNKGPVGVFGEGNGDGKDRGNTGAQHCAMDRAESKASSDAIDPGGNGTKPQSFGNGKATQAQCRALYALTKRAQYTDQDIESMLRPMSASTFQELSRESASQLITYLQTEVAA